MADQSPTPAHATFVLERAFNQPVARVFSLLAKTTSKRRWLLEDDGTTIDSFEMDFRVGGTETARYSIRKGSPVDGLPFVNEGTYLDIVPDRRVVMAFSMSIGGRRISVTLITFDLVPSGAGTTLTLIHQGLYFESSGGPEMRELGWNTLMDRLVNASESELQS
ncbi:MAG: SRPBCC domain-containing protein [Gemmatimonas sp.]